MKKTFRQLTPIRRLHALLLSCILSFLFSNPRLSAQCSPDVTPPDITCPANIVDAAPIGQCDLQVLLSDPIVSDNCAGTIQWTNDAPPNAIFPLGVSDLIYTATDVAGNTATCQITVTINGGIAAPACNAEITVQADLFFGATLVAEDLLEGGPYNCSNTAISLTIDGTPTPSVTLFVPGNYTVFACVSTPAGDWNRCWGTVTVTDECTPDVTPPTPNCDFFIQVEANTYGPNLTRLYADVLDNGSTDNCTNDLKFRVTTESGSTPPDATYLDIVGVPDPFEAFLWICDQSGNWSNCTVFVVPSASQCSPDVLKPSVTRPPDLTFTVTAFAALELDFFNLPEEFPDIRAAFGEATHWDNCDNESSALQESFVIQSDEVLRRFFVTDDAGNLNDLEAQYITILNTFSVHVPGWLLPGDAADTMSYNGGIIAISQSDEIFETASCGQSVRIHRSWGLADWEFVPLGGEPAILPALDIDNDGMTGDPYDIIAIDDSIWLYQNHIPTQALVKRAWSYKYEQRIRNSYPVTGTVFLDASENCLPDTSEPNLEGWKVKMIGQPSNSSHTVLTDGNGAYTIQVCPGDTTVEISLDVPFNAGLCASAYLLNTSLTASVAHEIPVQLNMDCALLSVDISTPYLRPCFTGNYAVNYYNYSGQTIEDTYVDVELDTFVQFTSSTLPGVLQSGNTYRFQTGDLEPGEYGQFKIHYLLDCDAPMGLTHCTDAHIYPVEVCPPEEAWSGAELRVSGYCDGDSVRLNIINTGSGDMVHQINYVVTEDLIMARNMPFLLSQGIPTTMAFPSNGATWRLETPQEPGHPWGGKVMATVEGCGGLNTPGLVNLFTMDNPDPFSATDCTQNSSSFDPNDKQAFPQGYGDQHFIERNTDLEYRIRFQNTGTDTAFTVIILDTLSGYLNAVDVRTGASSHAYDFTILNGNVLRFRFNNILLPDSSTNEAASHGFVQFRVQQQPDNPLGTVITNSAAIYFDFNDPVITNETRHTVEEEFLEVVAVNDPGNSMGALKVYPNPAAETIFFELPEAQPGRRFELTDGTGRMVRTGDFSENVFRFERGGLPAGVYFFRINGQSGGVVSGKIVVK